MSDFRNETNASNSFYFSIRKSTDDLGRPCAVFATKVPKGTPGAKQAFKVDGTPVAGKDGEVWHQHFNVLEGRMVRFEEKPFEIKGKTRQFLNIHIQGKSDRMVLSMERGDRYWVDWLKRLLNVDLEKPVKFKPYCIEDGDRTNHLLTMKQGEKFVEMVWNKENNWGNDATGAGGLPSGEKYTDPGDGEEKWSFLKRDRFLEEKVLRVVGAQLEAIQQNGGPQAPIEEQVGAAAPTAQAQPHPTTGSRTYAADAPDAQLSEDDLDQLPF